MFLRHRQQQAEAPTSIECKDTMLPSPRWNGGTSLKSNATGLALTSRPGSSRGRENLALRSGKSLQSLKAYYCKLRVFKGTVKALINLRRFPAVVVSAKNAVADASEQLARVGLRR